MSLSWNRGQEGRGQAKCVASSTLMGHNWRWLARVLPLNYSRWKSLLEDYTPSLNIRCSSAAQLCINTGCLQGNNFKEQRFNLLACTWKAFDVPMPTFPQPVWLCMRWRKQVYHGDDHQDFLLKATVLMKPITKVCSNWQNTSLGSILILFHLERNTDFPHPPHISLGN